ncbi:MAG TPA: 3-deoxy-8-phosphooctulonate synthase, partial [Candidatus Ozemobacteraceae bacterium]
MNDTKARFSLRAHAAGAPFFLIAGPCVLQEADEALLIAETVKTVSARLGLPAVFKASFDKANRTSGEGKRGPGMESGLAIMAEVKRRTGLSLLTDIHLPDQAAPAAEVCDMLQIPAFLCRQTDLLQAAARVCRSINVKKGQFLAPTDTRHIVTKIKAVNPDAEVILTERGTSFGYGNLVVDMRCLPIMKKWADAVVFDGTHSLQLPGASGDRTGGQREFIP